MRYRLPAFNIEVGIWRHASDTDNPPDVVADANFCGGRRSYGGNFRAMDSPPVAFTATAYLLLPKDTDVIGDTDTTGDTGDTVEIPLGSGQFYKVLHEERTALGFPNQHLTCIVSKAGMAGHTGGSGGDGGDPHGLMLEAGDFILQEGGDNILSE